MAVKTTDITNPEQQLDIQTRAPAAAPPKRDDEQEDLPAALKARIEGAKRIEPKPNERHCLDCFQRGRNAAIRAIVGPD